MFNTNINALNRQEWLKKSLAALPAGFRLLDAGAGELQNRQNCVHLDYVSQDFCQFTGGEEGLAEDLQFSKWDISRIDLVSNITAIPAPDDSFDAILCSEVLEHVPEPTHALDEFSLLRQEIARLGGLERQRGNWAWPLAYAYALLGVLYFKLRGNQRAEDLACFGWHYVAKKCD